MQHHMRTCNTNWQFHFCHIWCRFDDGLPNDASAFSTFNFAYRRLL